jgi:histidyl-tRNA synthetase
VENTFTFEEARRERWQCGAELVGSSQPLADVELMMLASEVLGELGIGPLEVRLCHAGLIKALITELGWGAAEQTEIFDRILEGDREVLGEIKTEDVDLKRALTLLLDVTGSSSGFLENIRALLGEALPRFEPSLSNLTSIAELLSAMDCLYHIDSASGRGFEYYTGVMFQFYVSTERLGGGGRYDDLIPLLGGPPVPASGFALYMDQLMDLVKVEEHPRHRILVQSQSSNVEGFKSCFEVARFLREAGYLTELDQGQKAVGNYRWVLSVLSEGLFRLTDQTTGEKSELTSAAEVIKLMEGTE